MLGLVSSSQILCFPHLHNLSYGYSDLLTVEPGPTLEKQGLCNKYFRAYFKTVQTIFISKQIHDQ